MPDFSKCDAKYSTKWSQAETEAGGMCPSSGDEATVQAFLSQGTNALGVTLAGGMLPMCGNGVVDLGEQCDQSNLNGQTCASLGFAAGVIKCGAGCMFDTSGCSGSRFVNNGDGTVSDLLTGLMWEQKTAGHCVLNRIACFSDQDCIGNGGGGTCESCLHCVMDTYSWTSSGRPDFPPDGTAFLTFLYGLNGGPPSPSGGTCYAGHCDWRLPTVDELSSIYDITQGVCPYLLGVGGYSSSACIDPFFGPTEPSEYWAATTHPCGPSFSCQDSYDTADAVHFGAITETSYGGQGRTVAAKVDYTLSPPWFIRSYVRAVRSVP